MDRPQLFAYGTVYRMERALIFPAGYIERPRGLDFCTVENIIIMFNILWIERHRNLTKKKINNYI